jgi:hypothetical protein
MNYGTAYATAKYAEESDSRQMVMPKKRQGWIKRLLSRSRDDEGANMNQSGLTVSPSRIERGEPQIDQPERAIQFTVYNANGGRVVETRRYDRQKDRSQTGLYIITGEQDFGHEIDKIITMEALR